MIIPIRCFSCGKLIAHVYEDFKEMTEKGEPAEEVFRKLGIKRFCCKRMIIGHVELIDELLRFPRLQ